MKPRLVPRMLLLALFVVPLGVALPATPARADDGVIAEFSGGTLLGVAQNDWHWWGTCRVRDFNGGAWGWYLRASTGVYAPTMHIRHGMLQGYTATGGPGTVGCPTSEEFGWYRGVRQNFTNGYLYWQPGMSRAIAAVNGTATRWAMDQLGQTYTSSTTTGRWSGWCLRFSYLAHGRAWSVTGSAKLEWERAVRLGRANTSWNPARGAIVYYNWADLGHAGVFIGDGWVVSTQGGVYDALPVRLHQIGGIGLTYRGWAWPLN
jgi:hypothetical protein